MKPYQDHNPIRDKSKAAPHPKRPTSHSARGKVIIRMFKNHAGPLYAKLPRDRKPGIHGQLVPSAYIRTDCCRLSHA